MRPTPSKIFEIEKRNRISKRIVKSEKMYTKFIQAVPKTVQLLDLSEIRINKDKDKDSKRWKEIKSNLSFTELNG